MGSSAFLKQYYAKSLHKGIIEAVIVKPQLYQFYQSCLIACFFHGIVANDDSINVKRSGDTLLKTLTNIIIILNYIKPKRKTTHNMVSIKVAFMWKRKGFKVWLLVKWFTL